MTKVDKRKSSLIFTVKRERFQNTSPEKEKLNLFTLYNNNNNNNNDNNNNNNNNNDFASEVWLYEENGVKFI